jgi:ABC-type glutathione transport system ATPase component
MSVVVEVEGLVKVYGAHTAVDGVSFTVEQGRSTALVGESGAGKSTIAAVLTGLQAATAGRVAVCGEDRTRAARSAAARRRRAAQLQIVPQDPFTSLDPRQRVGSVLLEALRVHIPRASRERVASLLDEVGLTPEHADRTPGGLSGGQRQRVAIARAIAVEPEIIVLDEAVSALDVSVQAQVLNLLGELQRRTGVAYLFITHDLGVVRQVADDVIVLRRGAVVEHGPAGQVLDEPRDDYTKLLIASTPGPGWVPVRRDRFSAR